MTSALGKPPPSSTSSLTTLPPHTFTSSKKHSSISSEPLPSRTHRSHKSKRSTVKSSTAGMEVHVHTCHHSITIYTCICTCFKWSRIIHVSWSRKSGPFRTEEDPQVTMFCSSWFLIHTYIYMYLLLYQKALITAGHEPIIDTTCILWHVYRAMWKVMS